MDYVIITILAGLVVYIYSASAYDDHIRKFFDRNTKAKNLRRKM